VAVEDRDLLVNDQVWCICIAAELLHALQQVGVEACLQLGHLTLSLQDTQPGRAKVSTSPNMHVDCKPHTPSGLPC